MRRQVRPFVTEYRGNARRGKDLHSPGDLLSESQAPRSRSYAEAEKLFQSETSEDSYEAALRAADALFDASPRSIEPTRSPMAASTSEPRRVMPASSPFRMPPDEATNEIFAGDDAGATTEALESNAAVSPRRILQAIEPPVENRFAALEAEHAPKRRGRKPGSKNKPKIVVGDDWEAPRPASATVLPLPAAAPVTRVTEREPMSISMEPEPDAIVDAVNGLNAVDDDQAMPQPRGRNDKFGWRRGAGLRPGERWKRRLPTAAW